MSQLSYLMFAAAWVVSLDSSAQTFTGVGDLPGGSSSSTATGISGDGSVIVGFSNGEEGDEAFRWTEAGGIQGLGDLPGGNPNLPGGAFSSSATGASADGSVIVGSGRPEDFVREAFRWTEAGGLENLGVLPNGASSVGRAISDDGSAVAGDGAVAGVGTVAFRWTVTGGFEDLGTLDPNPGRSVLGFAISADGNVVAGQSRTPDGQEAFRWTAAGGMVGLGDLPGGPISSLGLGISSDGSTIVGAGSLEGGLEAMFWTQADGMVGIGDLSGGGISSRANDTSADGSVIVGQGTTDAGIEAFIWDEISGIQNLKGVLENDLGLDLTDWTLQEAKAISDDGLVVVGFGTNPDGNREGWVAMLPEPPATPVYVLAVVLLSLFTPRAHRRS